MSYWNCRPDGVLEFVPEKSALNLTLREVFAEGKLTVSVHASGIQYAILKIQTPEGITAFHNSAAMPRHSESL
ncbi:MAG: hypothetical protein Tsb002_34510 [Wenzhouxiangellaceae bacterium]